MSLRVDINTESVLFIIEPGSFINVLVRVNKLAVAMLFVLLEITVVTPAILPVLLAKSLQSTFVPIANECLIFCLPLVLTETLNFVLKPVAFIRALIFRPILCAISVFVAKFKLGFTRDAVWPLFHANAILLVVVEAARILDVFGFVVEGALPMHVSVEPITCVGRVIVDSRNGAVALRLA